MPTALLGWSNDVLRKATPEARLWMCMWLTISPLNRTGHESRLHSLSAASTGLDRSFVRRLRPSRRFRIPHLYSFSPGSRLQNQFCPRDIAPGTLRQGLGLGVRVASIRSVIAISEPDFVEQDVGKRRNTPIATVLEHGFQAGEITQECNEIA